MYIALEIVYVLLNVLLGAVCAYHAVIIVSGLFKKRKVKPKIADRLNSFCVLICARNEEKVIGNIIDSIKAQNYPKELIDVYVVADNCTDKTADIARAKNAHVLERFDEKHKGKGFALKYFFENIDIKGYDAYCIFDADNTASRDFIAEMNSHINCGEKIIQGFRCVSNPTENAVSACYTLYFSFIMKYYMRARYNRGLSCIVSGTGFVFTRELIENGWNTNTVTEDAEFSIQNIIKGDKVALAENAIFYDEQPTSFSASITQRHRWTVGTVQLLKSYTQPLLNAGKNAEEKHLCLDTFMFLVMAPVNAVPILASIISPLLLLAMGFDIKMFLLITAGSLISAVLSSMLFAYVVSYLVGERVKDMWRGILFYPIFCFSWSIISLVSCFNDNCSWKPIAHTGKKSLANGR